MTEKSKNALIGAPVGLVFGVIMKKVLVYFLCLGSSVAFAQNYAFWRHPMWGNAVDMWGKKGGVHFFDMAPGTSFKNHTNFNVDFFSNLGIPLDSRNQASVNPAESGTTSIQWYQDKKTAWLHSWSVGYSSNPVVKWWSIAFGGGLDSSKKAWQGYGVNAKLCFTTFHKVSYLYTEPHGVLYSYVGVFLRDLTTGTIIPMTISMWDSRPNLVMSPVIAYDPVVGNYAGSWFGDSRYSTLMQHSATFQSGGELAPRWYGTCITRNNIKNLAEDFGVRSGKNISINADDYVVDAVYLQAERGNHLNSSGQLLYPYTNGGHAALSFWEDKVFTYY